MSSLAQKEHENFAGDIDGSPEPEVERFTFIAAAAAGDITRVRELIAAGSDVNARDEHGFSALAMAAIRGHEAIVWELEEAGARLDSIHPDLTAVEKQFIWVVGDSIVQTFLNINRELADNLKKYRLRRLTPVADGNVVLTRALLMLGVLGSTPEDFDEEVLMAASQGHSEIVKILIDAGALENVALRGGAHYVAAAAAVGSIDIVEMLLTARADPDVEDLEGLTALMVAARKGHVNILRLLISYHKDSVNLESSRGITALDMAVVENQLEAARMLLDAGANVYSYRYPQDDYNLTNLAVSHDSAELTRLLLAAKARPATVAESDYDPLIVVASRKGNAEIVQDLLNFGIRQLEHNQELTDAMYEAVKNGNINVVKVLAEAGANVNMQVKDCSPEAPLLLAAHRGDLAALETIIKAGAYINAAYPGNVPALWFALRSTHMDCFRALIAAKAELEVRDEYGHTLLMGAAHMGELDAVQELIRAGANVNAQDFYKAGVLSHAATAEVANVLLAARAALDARDGYGLTPLMYAARLKRAAVVETLLKAGAIVNDKSYSGLSALLESLSPYDGFFDEGIVRMLLTARADVDGVDPSGNGALLLAVRNCRDVSLVEALLDAGLAVNARHSNGTTALMQATLYDKLDMVSLLITRGADVNIREGQGNSVLAEAVAKGNIRAAKLLLDAGARWEPLCPAEMNAFVFACGDYRPRYRSDVSQADQEGEGWAGEQGDGEECDGVASAEVERSTDGENAVDGEHVAGGERTSGGEREHSTDSEHSTDGERGTDSECGTDVEKRSVDEASEDDAVQLIEMLIAIKADVNVESYVFRTPLIAAVKRPRILQLLLSAGARVDTRGGKLGQTAIIEAAWAGARESVELLLQAKADPNAIDFHNGTALRYAVMREDVDMVRLLVDAGAKSETGYSAVVSPLAPGLAHPSPDMVRVLLDGKADVQKLTRLYTKPLEDAVLNNKIEAIELLVKAGLDMSHLTDISAKLLPTLVLENHSKMLRHILDAKAPVDVHAIKPWKHYTPLMIATVLPDRVGIIEMLLAAGARVDACVGEEGNTALMSSSLLENPKLLKKVLCVLCRQVGYLEPLEHMKNINDEPLEVIGGADDREE